MNKTLSIYVTFNIVSIGNDTFVPSMYKCINMLLKKTLYQANCSSVNCLGTEWDDIPTSHG